MYAKLIEALASQTASDDSLETHLLEVNSTALERAVLVSALVPAGGLENLTVFIHLDGGVGDRASLIKRKSVIENLTQTGLIPQSIHVSFSGGANEFYTGEWEKWGTDELPHWAHEHFRANVSTDTLLLMGISAGGYGALKIAFKHPDRFKAVAAMEPVVMPSFEWPEQHKRGSWWMLEDSAQAVWGDPFPKTFLADHPPNIMRANAQKIIGSGLDIYLEVGDEDYLNLQDGAEFLHRVMWTHDVPHEFHQVRWADHGGQSIDDRLIEALLFLSAALAGGKKESRDLPLSDAEQLFIQYVHGGGPMRGEQPPAGASSVGVGETELTVMAKIWEPLRNIAEVQDADMSRHYGIVQKYDN